jgi:hypothetical protein
MMEFEGEDFRGRQKGGAGIAWIEPPRRERKQVFVPKDPRPIEIKQKVRHVPLCGRCLRYLPCDLFCSPCSCWIRPLARRATSGPRSFSSSPASFSICLIESFTPTAASRATGCVFWPTYLFLFFCFVKAPHECSVDIPDSRFAGP